MDANKLEATRAGISMLKELGLPVNVEQLQNLREQEAQFLSENVVPKIQSQIQALVEQIHIPFELYVEYQYGKPVQVRLVEKEGSIKSRKTKGKILTNNEYSSADIQKAWEKSISSLPKGPVMYKLLTTQKYGSLSQLLKGIQANDMMRYTSSLFEMLNFPTSGKVTPREFIDMLEPEQFILENSKDGSSRKIILWKKGPKMETLEDGTRTKVFEKDGVTPVLVDKIKRVKDEHWSLKVLCDLMFQKNYFAQKHLVEQTQ